MPDEIVYTYTGNVLASGGMYIRRHADDELLKLCIGKNEPPRYAYVLAPRQVGKSSLVTSTAKELTSRGIRWCIIDLNQVGVSVEQREWYLGQLVMIADQLNLKTDVFDWWAKQQVGVSNRMIRFYRTVLLKEVAEPVVIFVDEIESTRTLTFTDDFYAAIRSMFNARAAEPDFRRLSFVLIGSASPSDLIKNPAIAPFNIARPVELTDFTLAEARPLAEGFGLPTTEAEQILTWIIKWTGGHPYLTQRACRAIVDKGRARWSEREVDEVVADTFFGEMSEKDNNLLVVRDMLTKHAPNRKRVLLTYRDVYKKSPIVYDDDSKTKSYLKLVGVVHRQRKSLDVRNRIYRRVFNGKWVKKSLATT